ncbi:MAG: sigma-70 family RNA polymerase sigma factor [Capsulimonadales bacterium]|nr:sigma-70 family RNA polymerase sigma factor [Capsulimonadales bacterium]
MHRLMDTVLVRKTLAGDKNAFALLYRRHGPRVFRLLRRLTGGNNAESEDLVQETFLAAYQHLADWRGEGAFPTWLCGIAYRRWCASRRDAPQNVPLDEDLPVAAPDADPFALLSARELESALETVLASLPEHYRVVYLLTRVEEMKYREVAELLEIPLGTVQSRLDKAIRLLYDRLSCHVSDVVTLPKGAGRVPRKL